MQLFHFSEDPTIERFVPHVPRTNPTQAPAVWAIDEDHQPLYWFPRDCPRVTAWPRGPGERAAFEVAFSTTAPRVHAIEQIWLGRMRATQVYRYTLPTGPFRPWEDASGQWIAHDEVTPLGVEPLADLVAMHRDAGIDLRAVPNLWPFVDIAQSGGWDFSIVRIANAQPPD